MKGLWGLLLAAALLAVGCAPRAARPTPGHGGEGADYLGEGLASFYGPGLYGHRTANGERMERGHFTAAHRSLRFGTCLRVVNVGNGRAVNVRVNDRGPFVSTRLIDVSETAAQALGMVGKGVTRVRLYRCAPGEAASG